MTDRPPQDDPSRPSANSRDSLGSQVPALRRGKGRPRVASTPTRSTAPTSNLPGPPKNAARGGELAEWNPGGAGAAVDLESADTLSDPGGWNRFCTRAVQRWPLLLGMGLLIGIPAAALGYTRGEQLYRADVSVELQPTQIRSGSQSNAAVPAAAVRVAELLQRENSLLSDLAKTSDHTVEFSSRPPFGLSAAVLASSPEAAEASAEALRERYTQATHLMLPESLSQLEAKVRDQEALLDAARTRLTETRIDIGRAEERLAAGGDLEALRAEEATAESERRRLVERLAEARSSPRDPLVFLPDLLRKSPDAALALEGGAQAIADAMAAAPTGRGVRSRLGDAAAATAAFVRTVDDHRLVSAERGTRAFVRPSELAREAETAAARLREASAAAGIASLERSALQSLRWKLEGIEREAQQLQTDIERTVREFPAAASLASAQVVAASPEAAADTRPRAALFGGLLGVLAGVLAALGWVAVDDRVRQSDARPWAARGLAVLGTVPAVSEPAETDQPPTEASERRARSDAAALADAVHAIRAVLDGRDAKTRGEEAEGGRAFAITSSESGSGKTGLCLGLAASLAAAGERVLLVDAAWANRPGASEGPQSRQTLEAAAVAMGYLHPEDVDALTETDDEPVGLLAFLAGASLQEARMATRIPGLSLLGAGPGQLDPSRLSGRHIRRLVEASRADHEVMLIDTSAINAGLDALFVASAVDGVVLVVSSGEHQSKVDKAVARLRASGARVLGTVLNRVGKPAPVSAEAEAKMRSLPGGWQDQGSGMFAAAVGGPARSPEKSREASAAPEAEAPTAAPVNGHARVAAAAAPVAVARRMGDAVTDTPAPSEGVNESLELEGDLDDLNLSDEPSRTDKPGRTDEPGLSDKPGLSNLSSSSDPSDDFGDEFLASDVLAGVELEADEVEAPSAEADDATLGDVDQIAEDLAERLASDPQPRGDTAPEEATDEATDKATDELADIDAPTRESHTPHAEQASRPDLESDSSLDRLVDRHIDASLSGSGESEHTGARPNVDSRR